MTFEDEARKDLEKAFEQSAEQVRQMFDQGSAPTAEEMISTLRELVTAAANNTVRLAAVVDKLWDGSKVLVDELQALKSDVNTLKGRP